MFLLLSLKQYTLQLAINAALNHPEIQVCITACRNVVTHFNLSTKSTEELRKQAVGKPKALQQDVPTHYILHDEVATAKQRRHI